MKVPGRALAWAAVTGLVAVAGATGTTAALTSPPAPATSTPATTTKSATGTPPSACLAHAPTRPNTPSENDTILVPEGATSVLLCEYNTLNPPLGLVAERTVTELAVIGRLTSEANSGSVPPPGTVQSCPADLGEDVDAYFVYPNEVLWLWVDTGGCNRVIDRYGWSEDGVLAQDLRTLLGQ